MEIGSKMKPFMDKDFLLESETAKFLYHEVAATLPIIDYHNHLSAKELYENKQYANLAEVWLGGDHYKWRQLRTNGIDEAYITGNTAPLEKFKAYASTLQYLIGNPLYHWSHLELQRHFHIYEPLTLANHEAIYEKCNALLQTKEYGARGLVEQMRVTHMCTTDDPIDTLEYHKALKAEGYAVQVLPTYRPDRAIHLDKAGYVDYMKQLGEVVGYELQSIDDVEQALQERLHYFIEAGCVISDHGLDQMEYALATKEAVNEIYQKAMKQEVITKEEQAVYKGHILVFLGRLYAKHNMVMQIHVGALRNNSTRRFKTLGADTGFDSINDSKLAQPLSMFLNALDVSNELPKTILYSLNPNDNEVIATMCGNFQDGITPGKIQFGSGWWFNDQKDGMERQMEALMQLGMISRFVGMLTDSRSFLSFPRHEYFRRILCNKIGHLVESGQYPNDQGILKEVIENICYYNAKNYLQL